MFKEKKFWYMLAGTCAIGGLIGFGYFIGDKVAKEYETAKAMREWYKDINSGRKILDLR